MSQSFADIYSKWEQTHDEKAQISKKIKKEEQSEPELTFSQVKSINVQDELDLHNVKYEDAIALTGAFIDNSRRKGLRKVRIITGKGIHSPGGKSVIRPAVIQVLESSSSISQIDTNPKAADGGSGAIIVILKK